MSRHKKQFLQNLITCPSIRNCIFIIQQDGCNLSLQKAPIICLQYIYFKFKVFRIFISFYFSYALYLLTAFLVVFLLYKSEKSMFAMSLSFYLCYICK